MSDSKRPVGRPCVLGASETLRVRIPVKLGEAIRAAAAESDETGSVVVRRALEIEFLGETPAE